jgi:cell division protein FtsL
MVINSETIIDFCKTHWSRLLIIALFLLIWMRLAQIERINNDVRRIKSDISQLASDIDDLKDSVNDIYVSMPTR